jgi:hypothetical protein
MEKFEIRDLRKKDKFVIDDEYLNGYAKLCGINATGVYVSLCRHANKQQTCFPSKELLANELNISERSVYSALKKLEEWNIIKTQSQGRKDNGSFKNNIYTLLDKSLWKNKPQANNADGTICLPPQANNDISRRHVVPNKETHIKETHSIATALPPPPIFNYDQKLNEWQNDKKPHVQLIARFFKAKGLVFETEEQMTAALKRHCRAAVEVVKFSKEQIKEAEEKMQQNQKVMENNEWTIETLLKYLTK